MDEKFIKKTFILAKKGEGKTNTNPIVGAILVKNNKIIGQGYHQKFGGNHAEVNAILDAEKNGNSVKNSTLYLNLEPCCNFGKTPPCTDKIISSGIKKVVCADIDPNPKVNGKGLKIMEKAGIEVKYCLLKNEANRFNEHYYWHIKNRRPFVALKIAQSLDGKIASASGDSKWITNEKSRKYVHKLRNKYDAILVGINTIIIDNSHLGVRFVKGADPIRVILDPHFRIPENAAVLRDNKVIPVTLNPKNFSTKQKELYQKLLKQGIKFITFDEKIDLEILMSKLYELNIGSILVEGGAYTFSSFLKAKLINKIYTFIAPIIIGNKNSKSAFDYLNNVKMTETVKVKKNAYKKFDENILIISYV